MVFRAAFDAVLQDAADAALAALDVEGTVAERLDGYLQRANGDAYDAMAATPFRHRTERQAHNRGLPSALVRPRQRRRRSRPRELTG